MAEKKVRIESKAGLHARPAAMLVELASTFSSDIHILKDSQKINAKSILGLLTIGAVYGTELILLCEGEDEEEALEALVELFNRKFDE